MPMKKITACLLSILCSHFSGFAQVEKTELPNFVSIGEAKRVGTPIAKLGYAVSGNDTTYAIYFTNLQYKHLTDVQHLVFTNEGGAVDSLYKVLKSMIGLQNGTIQTYRLGDRDILVKAVKVPGFKGVNVTDAKTGANFGLNAKQLSELFGRKDDD